MSRGVVSHGAASEGARPWRGFRGALGYLFRDRDEAVTTVVIGGLCTFLSFLIVPQVVVLGYVVRVLRADDDDRPPAFDRLGSLLVDGTKAYVIWLAWMIVPLAVDVGLNGGNLEPGEATGWLLGWVLAPGVVSIAIDFGVERAGFLEWYRSWEPYVVLLLVLYVLPGALANFAARGTLRAGFFDDGLKRKVDWALARLGGQSPALADLLQGIIDHFFGGEGFSPVRRLRTRTYVVGWLGFLGFYLGSEAVLRLFLYLPSDGGGVLTVLSLLYLVVALPAYFVVRIAGWVVIGRTWATLRAADEPTDPEHVATGDPSVEIDPRSTERGLPLVDTPVRTVVAGGLFLVFGILAVPSVFVAGYLLRVLRATAETTPTPSFGGVRALLTDGLRAYVVWFVYSVVPLALLFGPVTEWFAGPDGFQTLVAWSVVAGVGLPGGFPAVYLASIPGVVVFGLASALAGATDPGSAPLTALAAVGVVGVLASQYVVPAALVAVARTGSIRAGLSPERVLPTLRRPAYARNWVGAALVATVGWGLYAGMVLSLGHPALADASAIEPIAGLDRLTFFSVPTTPVGLVLWVGLPVAGLAYFLALVAACRLVGRAAGDGTSTTAPDSGTDAAPDSGTDADLDADVGVALDADGDPEPDADADHGAGRSVG
jgi:hypothetical protein